MKGFLLVASQLIVSLTSAQQASQTQPTCNSCCQGPIGSQGTPGSHGIPGTNGMPGSMGPKGDPGISVKGDLGPPGDSGSPGLKGEPGMVSLRGPVGKIGPAGVAGAVGASGLPGVKGQKGEVGQSRVSAFSAVRSYSFNPSSNGQALPFNQIHTNVGDDFDASTGLFTCQVPGIYIFTYSVATYKHNPVVCLNKNTERINCVYRTTGTRHDVISNTAVLQVAIGDTVSLKCRDSGDVVYSDTNRYTTFSGAILHEM